MCFNKWNQCICSRLHCSVQIACLFNWISNLQQPRLSSEIDPQRHTHWTVWKSKFGKLRKNIYTFSDSGRTFYLRGQGLCIIKLLFPISAENLMWEIPVSHYLFNTYIILWSSSTYLDFLSSPVTSDEKSVICGRNIWCEYLNVLVFYDTKFHPNFKKLSLIFPHYILIFSLSKECFVSLPQQISLVYVYFLHQGSLKVWKHEI